MNSESIFGVYDDQQFLFAGRIDAIACILRLRKEAEHRVFREAATEKGCDLHSNGKTLWPFPSPELTIKYLCQDWQILGERK